ncbi:lysophosphatidylcholine acyltransferase isoform X2 [Photinus pyralis]|nr:lysophosphatidylcholine acyltransferase isoform X2 [Photinus pyralis]
MNGKIAATITSEDSFRPELLNPFVHHLELGTTYEKIKTGLFTILLLPVRVVIICSLLIAGWMIAIVGLWGLTEDDLREKPVTGWRSSVRHVACRLTLLMFTVGGFRLKVVGVRATRAEAPVVALAPHSSFIDSICMVYMGAPSIVAKAETANIPFFGKLINFTQPVYVWRDDPDSRHNTIKEIISRATSDLDWPQILIFPEGTCTNRSCLITFKPGAFYPGVPIQPVCIRYPNKLDTVTWTWEGPSALKLLWLTLTQVYSYCEIEFLPVYTPSEAEKRDPKLFANNVRNVMAKALGVPVLDYTYDDCRLMTRAKEMNLPHANSLVEIQKLRRRLGLDQSNIEEKLLEVAVDNKNFRRTTLAMFANYLNLPSTSPAVHQLFRYLDTDASGVIDFREYLLGVLATCKKRNVLETIKIACRIYDRDGVGRLSLDDFAKVLNQTLAMRVNEAVDVFHQIDRRGLNYVTFENFKSYAEKKAEFASLFSISKEEKFKSKNGDLCPEYEKKVE